MALTYHLLRGLDELLIQLFLLSLFLFSETRATGDAGFVPCTGLCAAVSGTPAQRGRADRPPALSSAARSGRAPVRCRPTSRYRWNDGSWSVHRWRPAAACVPWLPWLARPTRRLGRSTHAGLALGAFGPTETRSLHQAPAQNRPGRTSGGPNCPPRAFLSLCNSTASLCLQGSRD